MPMSERDKLNRLEELKDKLFNPNYQIKIEHRDNFTVLNKKNVPDEWDINKEKNDLFYSYKNINTKTFMFKNFFIFSLIFFLITICYAAYVFFISGNTVSNDNIDISIMGNSFTAGGEELALVVGISNKNSSPLELADLVMEYPKSGAGNTVDQSQIERSRISLGTIPAGSLKSENVKMVLFGEQGTIRNIKFSLEYRVEGSNAIFVKDKLYPVTINSTPINITLDAPDAITPNQEITLNIKTTLNSTRPESNILLKVDYPPGFQFENSTPAPSSVNNVWILGDLAPGSEKNITITGKMIDVFDGEEKSFNVSSGSQSNTDKNVISEVFNSLSHVVVIKKPFIETKLFINGVSNRDYAVDFKTPINGTIQWVNNLDTKVNDLEIDAKITGNALDKKSIIAQSGFYDSKNDEIIWDKNSQDSFGEISPGESGSVNFSFSSLPLVSGNNVLINPLANINISISGKQMIEGYATKDLNNSDSSVVRIISDVGFLSKASYYSGPFKNTGPIPPKVENQTTYTVNWSLSNDANNISKATVHSSLPSRVNFVGISSPDTEDLVYNPSTKEIVWNVGAIPRGAGTTKAPRSVSFQVSISPSLSEVGKLITLINDALLTGHDDFANVDVKVNKQGLNTLIENDPPFPLNGGGTVVE